MDKDTRLILKNQVDIMRGLSILLAMTVYHITIVEELEHDMVITEKRLRRAEHVSRK